MKIVGCDLHARQQTIAMVDTETGEFTEKTLAHEGNAVREFYAALEGPVVVGIEATGAMQWFLELLEELGIECRVGHPAKIRAAETRKQKHDRRDARLDVGPAADGGSLSGDLDAVDRAAGLANLAAGPTPVGEDANAIAAHVASDRTQSRPATRPCSVECSGAERTAGLASASLHQSETDGTAELVRAVAAADPGAGSRSRSTGPTKAPGTSAADASRRGTGDGLGHRGVSRRPESLCHRQPGGQLYRDDPV